MKLTPLCFNNFGSSEGPFVAVGHQLTWSLIDCCQASQDILQCPVWVLDSTSWESHFFQHLQQSNHIIAVLQGFEPNIVYQLVLHFRRTLTKGHHKDFRLLSVHAFMSLWQIIRSVRHFSSLPGAGTVVSVAALGGNGSAKIFSLLFFTNILMSPPCSTPTKSAMASAVSRHMSAWSLALNLWIKLPNSTSLSNTCPPLDLLSMDDPVELPNLAALSTVTLLVDFILFWLSLRPEHSFNMSAQFCDCVFSHIDLQIGPLSLHGFAALCGASVLTDCVDRLFPLLNILRCLWDLSIVSSNGGLPVFAIVDCLLQRQTHFFNSSCVAWWTTLCWCLNGRSSNFVSIRTIQTPVFRRLHLVNVGLKHKEPLQQKTMQWKISLLNEVTIGLCCWWIKWIKLTPSGTQLTPDLTSVPFATSDAHLLMWIATSSNTNCLSQWSSCLRLAKVTFVSLFHWSKQTHLRHALRSSAFRSEVDAADRRWMPEI